MCSIHGFALAGFQSRVEQLLILCQDRNFVFQGSVKMRFFIFFHTLKDVVFHFSLQHLLPFLPSSSFASPSSLVSLTSSYTCPPQL